MSGIGEKHTLDGINIPTLKSRDLTMNTTNLSSSSWFFFNYDYEKKEGHCRIEGCPLVMASLNSGGGATTRLFKHLRTKHNIDRVAADELVSYFQSISGTESINGNSFKRPKTIPPTPQLKIYDLVMNIIDKCTCSSNLVNTKEFKKLIRYLLSSPPLDNVKDKSSDETAVSDSGEKHTLIIPTLKPRDSTLSTTNLSSSSWFFYNYDNETKEGRCRIEGCTHVIGTINTGGGATSRLYKHLRIKHNIEKEAADELVSHFQNISSSETQPTIVNYFKRAPSITPQKKIHKLVMNMISKCDCSLKLVDTNQFKLLERYLSLPPTLNNDKVKPSPLNNDKAKSPKKMITNDSGEKRTLDSITIPTLKPRYPSMNVNTANLSSSSWFFYNYDEEKKEGHCRVEGCSHVIGSLNIGGGATSRLYKHIRNKHNIDRETADLLVPHFRNKL